MKLDSLECRKTLEEYKAEGEVEALAIKVLLAKDEDVVKIPGITELSDYQIDVLAGVILLLRVKFDIEEA